jgi:hypothetical protein
MRTATQSRGRVDLANFAATFSKDVDKHLAAVQKQVTDRIRRAEAQRAAEKRAAAEKERREKPLIAKRVALARVGLARALALGQSAPIQQLIGSLERIGRVPAIELYAVTRPSGDEWDRPDDHRFWGQALRSVNVEFCMGYLALGYGNPYVKSARWRFAYDPAAGMEEEVSRSDEIGTDPEEFFKETVQPYAANLSLAQKWGQRSYEWDEANIAFEFFVSCARKSQFDRYVVRGMQKLQVETAARR